MSDNNTFKNAWLGYDLPFDEIEKNPVVLNLRQKGYEKRIKLPEYHITSVFFEQADVENISKIIAENEKEHQIDFTEGIFLIDSFGIIKHNTGSYAYFSIGKNNKASILKNIFKKNNLHGKGNCEDLHISIGGLDPFCINKPKQIEIDKNFNIKGKLVFVGQDNTGFKKLYWNSKSQKFEAYSSEDKKRKISKIIMPDKPHLDQIAACYLLAHYGNDRFPEIEKANIYFWDMSNDPPKEKLEEWGKENALLVDMGGGFFDHHKNGKFAAMLVAEFLAIADKPELRALLDYIYEDDQYGLHNKFGDLAQIIKQMYKQGMESQNVFNFTFTALNALVYFDNESETEFKAKAKIQKIKRGKNKIKMAIIESDNINIAKYAMQNEGIAIVIQKRSTGHIMIFTNHFFKIDLRGIIAAIRIRELEILGKEKEITNPNYLNQEGKITDVEHWYYHKSLRAILNGSESLSGTKPTALQLDEIVKIVDFGISSEYPEFCNKCSFEKCPYFKYNFFKCYQKRQEEKANIQD